MSLKDGIYYIDQMGFNAIDHTVINFFPTNNDYESEGSLHKNFRYFEFGTRS